MIAPGNRMSTSVYSAVRPRYGPRMSHDAPSAQEAGPSARHEPPATTRRDAANTRSLLVSAARRRFAHDGYRATTVRDVATDAGVNVALINRYFGSKEGLFEACLPRTAEELGAREPAARDLEEVVSNLVARVTRSSTSDDSLQLLLLLRSSGDEQADRIRRSTLQALARRLAAVAGWREGDPATEHLELRADVALATVLGVVLLRTTGALEPLASAGPSLIAAPLHEAVAALLTPGPA